MLPEPFSVSQPFTPLTQNYATLGVPFAAALGVSTVPLAGRIQGGGCEYPGILYT